MSVKTNIGHQVANYLFLLFSLMFESKVVQLVIIEVLEGEA